jgi:hypothetical protein
MSSEKIEKGLFDTVILKIKQNPKSILFILVLFIGIFVTQRGIGLIIDLAQLLGFGEILAFQVSFFVFLLSCIFSYFYFIYRNKKS